MIYDPPPLATQLATAAIMSSLPPQVLSEPPQTVTPAPAATSQGFVINTNPPAVDANDRLLFDPDELTTYDALGATPNLPPVLPSASPSTTASSARIGSGITIDLGQGEPAIDKPSSTWDWKALVIGVVVFLVLSMVLMFYMSSRSGAVVQGTISQPPLGAMGGMNGMNYGGGLPQPNPMAGMGGSMY